MILRIVKRIIMQSTMSLASIKIAGVYGLAVRMRMLGIRCKHCKCALKYGDPPSTS